MQFDLVCVGDWAPTTGLIDQRLVIRCMSSSTVTIKVNNHMPFHHVLVSLDPEPEKLRSVFTDLSESELKDKFLRPYQMGQKFVSENEIIPTDRIRKVHIVRTARANEVERSDIHKKSMESIRKFNSEGSVILMSGGRGYDPEDILEAGADVTAKYLPLPPGITRESTGLKRFVNHWISKPVTAIVALLSLLSVLITITLGWNQFFAIVKQYL